MNYLRKLSPSSAWLPIFIAAMVAPGAFAQTFNSGSTGADGAFSPTLNTDVTLPPSGILNYTTFNIPSGVKVTFIKNAANTPVYILTTGNVTIAGTIDIRGGDAAAVGTAGGGALGDDGNPGLAGPGGFDGGRGGRQDAALAAAAIRAGAGLGPGGGPGGREGGDGCGAYGYYPRIGTGGAHVTNAYSPYAFWNCGSTYPVTIFAKSYGSSLLQPLIGGSGGGGGRGGTAYPGSGGGGGGGAILIASSTTISVTGVINARGGDGGDIAGTGSGERGSGGAGGAIRLVANAISGNGQLLADGGCIINAGTARSNCGADGGNAQYGGSGGRIRLEAPSVTFSGTISPNGGSYYAVSATPAPVFIAGAPTLRIASVAGQAVPAVPTGVADVTLPASTTGPVVVTFATTNVPAGNTVTLRLAPAYGLTTEVLSPAIATDGTTQVSVTLPQGPSTLQATTTYTVVVGMADGEELSRFAKNERVEKVEVTVALQGGAKASLVTVSGKRYEVPYDALLAAGFRG